MASSIYLQDVDELKSQMNAIKQKLNTLEKTRNSEVSSLEDHLRKIHEKIHQLQFEDNFSSTITCSFIHLGSCLIILALE